MSRRLVKCNDCGYKWQSTAKMPRCTQGDCRGRDVETVETDEDADSDVADDGDDAEPVETDEPDEDVDSDDESDDESGGYEPMFKSRQQTADAEPDFSDPIDAVVDDEDDVEDDRDDEPDEDVDDERQESDDESIPEVDPADLKPIFATSFALADSRTLTDFSIEDEEADRLAEAWTPLANKYAPLLFKNNTEETVAVLATVAVLGPKLAAEHKAREERQEREDATDAEPGTVREPTTTDVEDAEESPEFTAVESTADQPSNNAFANV